MLISHTYKFIFIHNYKVAGSSIKTALGPYSDISFQQYSWKKKIRATLGLYPKVYASDFIGHVKAKDLAEKLPARMYQNYFKFGFVRNPWSWQSSLYKYALTLKEHHQHELMKSMKSFEQYLDWRINQDFHLQKEFFYDEQDNCLMDYIGKYETLEEDFNYVCHQTVGTNVSLPHVNKSENDRYLKFYTPKAIDMVYEAFKEDIDTFGYEKPILKH